MRTEGWSARVRWSTFGLQADVVSCVYLGAWSLTLGIISSQFSLSFHAVLLFPAFVYPNLAFFCGLFVLTIPTCSIVLAFLCNFKAVSLDQLEPAATLFPC
ncbi:uncharacterized protein M421DRAFT_114330 [Didymella exigua CBS 183.55]|uniref:Uncharacterized protein n=1 Tax=Didymella exigua CBS 183.55 TaxID=1150837 RepID=A0A6A5S9K8_9PLEO|nr:uncharacterized protein M421DRAFT_114330 [Didymella exigua CBS 183.55]KAF1934157.1 hypothetical protein M421DRAFT_114330 [Didymella exigua CBS 183.55]